MSEYKAVNFKLILPVYNDDATMEDTLADIFEQEYDDWELVILDDGSTDNSGSIADTYVEVDDVNVRAIHCAQHRGAEAVNELIQSLADEVKQNAGEQPEDGNVPALYGSALTYLIVLDPTMRYDLELLSVIAAAANRVPAEMITFGEEEDFVNRKGEIVDYDIHALETAFYDCREVPELTEEPQKPRRVMKPEQTEILSAEAVQNMEIGHQPGMIFERDEMEEAWDSLAGEGLLAPANNKALRLDYLLGQAGDEASAAGYPAGSAAVESAAVDVPSEEAEDAAPVQRILTGEGETCARAQWILPGEDEDAGHEFAKPALRFNNALLNDMQCLVILEDILLGIRTDKPSIIRRVMEQLKNRGDEG